MDEYSDLRYEKLKDKSEPLLPKESPFYEIVPLVFDEFCDENSQIEKIIFLREIRGKFLLLIFLNLVTLLTINLFISWFPILKLRLFFTHCKLQEADFLGIFGKDKKFCIVDVQNIELPNINNSHLKKHKFSNIVSQNIKMFSYKQFKYFYDFLTGNFLPLTIQLSATYSDIFNDFSNGLTSDEVNHQRSLFGNCDIDIQIDSLYVLTLKEISDPFYLFQIFSIILWFNNEYVNYACVIMVTTLLSLSVSVYEIKSNLENIKKMSKYECPLKIIRTNEKNEKTVESTSSINLVPGDLFELPEDGYIMPCDCILISGTAIINEAMLTGESTPIIKTHIQATETIFDINSDKKSLIYAGTKIVQKRALPGKSVSAIVVATGFSCEKGNLIRSILFPKENEFKFKKDSVKYILFMAVLSFGGFFLAIPFMVSHGIEARQIILKALDLITTTVPPALPACIGIGISIALSRLKKKGIFCINREKINAAGKINMICFDKTGTLTEDHLDIYGFKPVEYKSNQITFSHFTEKLKTISDDSYQYYKDKNSEKVEKDKTKEIQQFFIENLATCHSITQVNGKLIGDQIDLEMFHATGWNLYENIENLENYDPLVSTFLLPKNEIPLKDKIIDGADEDLEIKKHYELGIIRRFEFSSKLQRMSVIVRNSNEGYFKVFSKGSPEKIKDLCKPETIPKNFNQQLEKFTMKGYRVLALSMKIIQIGYDNVMKVDREKIENNMVFLGLMIVQNKLKARTKGSIEILHHACLKMVMATGDNILTAISVAKDCLLVKPKVPIYQCEIQKEKGESKLIWKEVDTDIKEEEKNERRMSIHFELNDDVEDHFAPETLSSGDNHRVEFPRASTVTVDVPECDKYDQISLDEEIFGIEFENIPVKDHFDDNIAFAISGPNFEKIFKLKSKYDETKAPSLKIFDDIFRIILRHTIIFARMSPEHKTLLVQSLMKEKFTVCMCGDGANDCGALKAADVGLSLSLEEASIAAPFTSNVPDISCLIKLLREGKASLVTSIQCFKYMMLYSLIQFISVTLLLILGSYLTDNQFLASDLFIIFPLAVLIARTGAYEKLTYHKPTGALISVPIITSILIQTAIQFSCQFGIYVWLSYQPWFIPYKDNGAENLGMVNPCQENTAIFLVSNLQYLIAAVAFSISKPFRKPVYSNPLLTLFLGLGLLYSYYIVIIPDVYNRALLSLVDFGDDSFKYYIIALSVFNFSASYLTEKVIVPFISKKWNLMKNKRLKKKLSEKNTVYNLNQLYKVKLNI